VETKEGLSKQPRWWTSKWFVFVSLLPLWPISLWFLWKSPLFSTTAKLIWTVVSIVLALWISVALVDLNMRLYRDLERILSGGL